MLIFFATSVRLQTVAGYEAMGMVFKHIQDSDVWIARIYSTLHNLSVKLEFQRCLLFSQQFCTCGCLDMCIIYVCTVLIFKVHIVLEVQEWEAYYQATTGTL